VIGERAAASASRAKDQPSGQIADSNVAASRPWAAFATDLSLYAHELDGQGQLPWLRIIIATAEPNA
jgi:hypothetical protein